MKKLAAAALATSLVAVLLSGMALQNSATEREDTLVERLSPWLEQLLSLQKQVIELLEQRKLEPIRQPDAASPNDVASASELPAEILTLVKETNAGLEALQPLLKQISESIALLASSSCFGSSDWSSLQGRANPSPSIESFLDLRICTPLPQVIERCGLPEAMAGSLLGDMTLTYSDPRGGGVVQVVFGGGLLVQVYTPDGRLFKSR